MGWIALLVGGLVSGAHAQPGSTSGWRGDGSGRYVSTEPPTKWSKDSQNILWKIELGRGFSSPVVVRTKSGDASRLIVAAEPADLVCVDPKDGKIVWRTSIGYARALGESEAARIAATHARFDEERREAAKKYDALRKSDPESSKVGVLKEKRKEIDQRRREFQLKYPSEKRGGAGNAAATVVCDGKHVFAVFGTGVVAAIAMDGNVLWARYVEAPQSNFGHSGSPVIAGGRLVVHVQQLTGLDLKTGDVAWRVDVPATHGTPAVARIGGQDVVVTPSGAVVVGGDGRVLATKQFKLSRTSPMMHNGTVYIYESRGVRAFRLPKSLVEPFDLEQLWECSEVRGARMASPLIHDGLLYSAGRRGILDVIDAAAGKLVYQRRLSIGELFSSPTFAGGQIYFGGRDGKMLVLRPGRKFDELAVNESEQLSASPAFAGRKMFLRANQFLYCIGQ